MKNRKVKKKIYLRIFSALLVAYLVLMAGFSIFMINQQNKVEGLQNCTTAMNINGTMEAMLRDKVDEDEQIIDIAEVNNECLNLLKDNTRMGIEVAIYARNFRLIFHTNNTNDNWLCAYPDVDDVSIVRYAYLNPKEFFTEEEVKEINQYRNTVESAKKISDFYLYSVQLKGFWIDNGMIIPKNIVVEPYYVNRFDESGKITDAIKGEGNSIVYTSKYENTKDLPYYEGGLIYAGRLSEYAGSESQKALIDMITDKFRLLNVVGNNKYQDTYLITERVSPVTYRYYVAVPNQDKVGWIRLVNNEAVKSNYGAFWTVVGFQTNLLSQCIGTLIFVWSSCFILFAAAALFLSVQTYKLYQKRVVLDQYRTETTNALAHDLKTPLSIISGYAQNLMENIHTEKREYYASNININVNRMDHIIKEMLDLSRYDMDYNTLLFEEVSLGELCTKLLEYYHQVCEEKHITASLEGDAIIKSDISLIERVIDNFFINAVDNTPEGGTIKIEISDNTLIFYNSGSHISEDIIDEIWQPYKKGDVSRSNKKGTGLGLSIASKILDLYQFSYGVKNINDGVMFWFKW
ncbi:MAG: HAMP domain-containing sensor histidine kinase [Mobilitalea sp.]